MCAASIRRRRSGVRRRSAPSPAPGRGADAALLTAFVLAGNTFLRPLVSLIDRIPISEAATEATYQVRVTTHAQKRDAVRDLLVDKLEAANYALAEIDAAERGEDEVELIATLAATTVVPQELNELTQQLEKVPGVSYATWTSSAAD